jgi:hypothetical protein
MQTALRAFEDCVAICDRQGFGRVALPNRIMVGHCLVYLQRADQAIAIISDAGRLAQRAENPQAEMFVAQSLGTVLVQSGRAAEAVGYLDTALAKARALGACRYESNILAQLAEARLRGGERSNAVLLAQEAVSISRKIGMGFTGPYALAVLAWTAEDPATRAAALSEGEMLLQQGTVGHNLVWYYRVASEVCMKDRNWQAAEICADRLRLATAVEPLPVVEFLIARTELLCRIGRGGRGSELRHKLDGLVGEGERMRHPDWLVDLLAKKGCF